MDRERADRARGEAQALRDTLPSPEPINSGQEWPEPMADDAFHGPMGELARRLAPHVEVNAEAILITGLVGFGNMIGRNPSFLVALDEHRCNLFAIQVGKSSRARKGMSWNLINGFLKPVDPEWATYRTGGGLSTGEGLIRAVEDEPDDENGQPVPQDKRQCFVETEFETVLDRMTRPGNTLSGLMRQAWDGTTMRTKTKDSPMTATDPHVSIVGHVTLKALRRKLDETDRSNGLGNRILWFCSERTEYIALPKAINPADDEWSAIVRALKAARTFASRFPAGRSLGSLLDREAQKRWEAIYDSYEREEDDDEAVDEITGRATANIARMALIFAVLDQSERITVDHLKAAQAVWVYCAESVRFIFGGRITDTKARKALDFLRARHPDAQPRSVVAKECFSNHVPSPVLDTTRDELQQRGLIKTWKRPTDGAPAEMWALPGGDRAPDDRRTSESDDVVVPLHPGRGNGTARLSDPLRSSNLIEGA